jgi:hypothetical protein
MKIRASVVTAIAALGAVIGCLGGAYLPKLINPTGNVGPAALFWGPIIGFVGLLIGLFVGVMIQRRRTNERR